MIDVQTGLIIAALFVAGLVFILLEVLTPSFGALAALAVGALVAAVWIGFNAAQWLGFSLLVVLVVGLPIYLAMLVKVLPKSPLGKRFFLGPAPEAPAAAAPEADANKALVGREAVAETSLRPAGAIRIDGRRVVATAETGMIERGRKVKIIGTTGSNVVVREADGQ